MRRKNQEAVAPNEPHLQIGEVAGRTKVTQRTLRFYEEKGLLKPPSRMEGGFRLYSEDDITRVEQIKELQQLLGFTLAEIKDMIDADEVLSQLRAEYRADAALPAKKAQVLQAIEVTERQYGVYRQKSDALAEMQSKLDERLTTLRGWLDRIDEALTTKTKPEARTKAKA